MHAKLRADDPGSQHGRPVTRVLARTDTVGKVRKSIENRRASSRRSTDQNLCGEVLAIIAIPPPATERVDIPIRDSAPLHLGRQHTVHRTSRVVTSPLTPSAGRPSTCESRGYVRRVP
jgi:hypothetical protein